MNKILVTLSIMLTIAIVAYTQDIDQDQVPSVILNNFKQQFPKVYDVEWEKKGYIYEVEFENEKAKEYEVTFDSTGKVLKLKAEISAKELNGAIKSTLRKEFSDCIISEVEMVEENGVKIYEMELKSIFQEWDVVLNEEGQILKRKED